MPVLETTIQRNNIPSASVNKVQIIINVKKTTFLINIPIEFIPVLSHFVRTMVVPNHAKSMKRISF